MKKVVLIITLLLLNINVVYAKEKVKFSDCVDGDTVKIILKNKEETLRLLAVDTPDSVHPTKGLEYYGKEASDFTCNTVKNAKTIEIEYDDNSDKRDKYDRLLVWLFVDNKLFQQELIENGYAKVDYLYDDYKYTSLLQEKEKNTKQKNIGIWNEEDKEEYNNNHNIVSNNEETPQEKTLIEELKELSFKELLVILLILIILLILSNNKKTKKLLKFLKKLK